ncbi:MAG: TetR/AcrR family transcriptional regulator [Epulopiscium sp.]|nr:TetR/AcrR family transcriptional regulator [Candidatus Epulonipiscium sp.]
MNTQYLNTREKILLVTIELFGSKGDMTTREIADKAGVNVASINYHFGSKKNLLKEVEKHYSHILYKMQSDILNDITMTATKKLLTWANHLMNFMFKHPALITLTANLVLEDVTYDSNIIKNFFINTDFKEEIQKIIGTITGISDEQLLNFKYTQIFSGILGPIIFQVISNYYGSKEFFLDLSKEDIRLQYVENLILSILQ